MINKIAVLNGNDVLEATLRAGRHCVSILNYGCVVRRWQVDVDGNQRDIVLGFNSFEQYAEHSACYFGVVAGRVANRTNRGQFKLNGQSYQLTINNGDHHLHGGHVGLGGRLWHMEEDADLQRVRLSYHSPDKEEGYPGDIDFEVIYELNKKGLHCIMRGFPDRPTPINLAQHNYYNLDGGGDIQRHSLSIDAEQYLPVSDTLLPTGELAQVESTQFDFRRQRIINSVDPMANGYDNTMVLRPERNTESSAALLVSSDQCVSLEVATREPGIQLFTATGLNVDVPGVNGEKYGKFSGICLEAQHFPDGLNQINFPSIIRTPDNPYHQELSITINVD